MRLQAGARAGERGRADGRERTATHLDEDGEECEQRRGLHRPARHARGAPEVADAHRLVVEVCKRREDPQPDRPAQLQEGGRDVADEAAQTAEQQQQLGPRDRLHERAQLEGHAIVDLLQAEQPSQVEV
jgi:hypothetical protein